MVVLILFEKVDERTKKKEVLVSHGVDMTTFENVVLPAVPPQEIGWFSQRMHQWILK